MNSLLSILAQHSIVPPPGIGDGQSYSPEPAGHVELRSLENPAAASVDLSIPDASGSSSSFNLRVLDTFSGSESESPVRSGVEGRSQTPISGAAASQNRQPSLLQDPRVGIDFVLTYVLRICLK